MEVLSSRMGPAFKVEENWKHKRVHDNENAIQAEVKEEHRPERTVSYDAVAMRESGNKRLHARVVNGWDGVGSQSTAVRSVGRADQEDAGLSHSYMRKPKMLQESSDDVETSHDAHPDDSDTSGDDEPLSPETTEAPKKWPIIQIVAPPPWLPEGWTAVLRTRESGSKDKYYVDPVSQRRFRSKTEVNYFLQTGKSYRYKRNLALLTKPLKEDPVSLPNSVSLRNVHVDIPSTRETVQTLSFMSPSVPNGGENRGTVSGQARSSFSPDSRLSILPQSELVCRKPCNKPGPKPRVRTFIEDPGKASVLSGPKRSFVDDKKSLESSQGQGTENRGKLILKLKRKTTELDEGERNGKKLRPFEVVGTTPARQGKYSSTSDEEEKHHTVESSSRAPVQRSLVPSTHVSGRPMTKAPLPSWQYQPHPSVLSRTQYGGGGSVTVSSDGQVHMLEKNSGSVILASTDPEAVRAPPKRESPAEQLQKLGRKLCQEAVNVLCNEYGEGNTLQQVSSGLHTSTSHGLSGRINTNFNSSFNSGFQTPPPCQQHLPIKRMRGSLLKEKSTMPMHYSLVPHSY